MRCSPRRPTTDRRADAEGGPRGHARPGARTRSRRSRRWSRLAPEFLRARYSLVSNLVQAKQIDRAAEQSDAVKKMAPNDPRTLLLAKRSWRSRAATRRWRSTRSRSRFRRRPSICPRATFPGSSTSSAARTRRRGFAAHGGREGAGGRRRAVACWRRRTCGVGRPHEGAGDARAGASACTDRPGAACGWPPK